VADLRPTPRGHLAGPTIRKIIGSSWREADPVLRRFSLYAWGLGGLAVVGAFWTDLLNVWQDLPFVTNLISALVGALFAGPVAVLILSGLSEYQVGQTELRRQEARVRAARHGMAAGLGTLKRYLTRLESEVTHAINLFVRAINADANSIVTETAPIAEIASTLRSFMDAAERTFFARAVMPVQLYAQHLQDALLEQSDGQLSTGEITELIRLSVELQLAVDGHVKILDHGLEIFTKRINVITTGRRPLLTELRDAALTYLPSIDNLDRLTNEMGKFCPDDHMAKPPAS
jgi:hypothetical protein